MAIKFTRLARYAIKNLPAGGRVTEHGISVARLSDGDLHYSINIMVDRRRIHRVIGKESEGITRGQALRAIESFRTKAREERLDLPIGRKTRITFDAASAQYLNRIKDHPKFGRNYSRKSQHISQHLVSFFRTEPLDGLNESHIDAYVLKRKGSGAANATINRELATLKHLLNRCVEWGLSKRQPQISMFKEALKKIQILSDCEQEALIAAAANDCDPDVWMFVIIAAGTGMRHGEIMRVRWEDIDFTNKRIYVEKAKAGQRHQPLPPSLVRALKAQWMQMGRPKCYLFPTRHPGAKEPYRSTMAAPFKRCVIKAGLNPKKTTPHILRHTAITKLVQAGVDLPTIQRFSGHKTLAMVLRYTQLSDEHLDRSVAKLDDALSKAITPKLHTAVE